VDGLVINTFILHAERLSAVIKRYALIGLTLVALSANSNLRKEIYIAIAEKLMQSFLSTNQLTPLTTLIWFL
jgi:hypothetical protein